MKLRSKDRDDIWPLNHGTEPVAKERKGLAHGVPDKIQLSFPVGLGI